MHRVAFMSKWIPTRCANSSMSLESAPSSTLAPLLWRNTNPSRQDSTSVSGCVGYQKMNHSKIRASNSVADHSRIRFGPWKAVKARLAAMRFMDNCAAARQQRALSLKKSKVGILPGCGNLFGPHTRAPYLQPLASEQDAVHSPPIVPGNRSRESLK